jgi:hypothetical protein
MFLQIGASPMPCSIDKKAVSFVGSDYSHLSSLSAGLINSLFAVLLVILFGSLCASGLQGAQPQAEVFPNSIELAPNGEVTHVLVVLRNTADAELRDIKALWINDEKITIAPDSQLLSRLAPHSETSWTFVFSQAGLDSVAGSVRLLIDYKQGTDTKVLAQSIPIKSREPVSIDKYLDAKIETTLEMLDSYHPARINLVLTNKSGRDITLNIKGSGPDFISFAKGQETCGSNGTTGASHVSSGPKTDTPGENNVLSSSETKRCPVQIGAYQTAVEVFEVVAEKRVEPGKYLLSFEIELSPAGTQVTPLRTVKSQVVEVGVLGESTVLKALGVPSFLLLPGSLMLLTVGLLRKYGPRPPSGQAPTEMMEPTSPYFWLVSITLSGLMAVLYRAISGSWYFVRYGLADVVLVWLFSIALGALWFGAWYWLEGRKTPTVDDDPLQVLRKLWWQRMGLTLDRYSIKSDGSGQSVFAIRKHPEEDKKIWVSPAIKIDLSRVESKHVENIRKQSKAGGNPHKLAWALRKVPQSAAWSTNPISSPKLLQLDELEAADRDTIVTLT